MKIIHKTLDNERIAMMLDILRRNLGEEFNADKLVIYVDGGQVIFTHPSTEEGGGYLSCGWDGPTNARADDPWWLDHAKADGAALRAS